MMKNKIFGNGRKKLSLTDVLGFAWYAIVAMSMVHQGNAARFGGAMADMSIMIPMYAVAVLLLLAVVIRISFGKWQGVRRLYALIVAGVAVALSFGMTMRLETQFLLSAGLMNAMNVVFAAHAVWRTGRYDEAEAGYPKALAWTGNCVGYVALVALALQVVELGVEYWAWVAKSGIVAAVVLCALVVTVLVAVSCFVNKNAVRKTAAIVYYAYSVLAVGAFFLVCYYLVYADTQVHEVVCRTYLNFREFEAGGFYPYDDMVVWRALNLLLSSLFVTAAFDKK